jgi:predicted transcriptional regulator
MLGMLTKWIHSAEMGIIADILGVTMDGGTQGVIVSAISRRANLSHYAVLEKCQKLIDAGLVESMKAERNRLFRVTEKGIRFFQEFQRFQGVMLGLNLRY